MVGAGRICSEEGLGAVRAWQRDYGVARKASRGPPPTTSRKLAGCDDGVSDTGDQ